MPFAKRLFGDCQLAQCPDAAEIQQQVAADAAALLQESGFEACADAFRVYFTRYLYAVEFNGAGCKYTIRAMGLAEVKHEGNGRNL